MQLTSILSPARTYYGAAGSSKKRVLQTIADFICETVVTLDPDELFTSLLGREKLGSTGLGNGVAIPHCRLANCTTVTGTLVRLTDPVDFDAVDREPVDLLFVLIVPDESNEEHLQVLAMLAELFHDADFRSALRAADSADALFEAAVAYAQKADN